MGYCILDSSALVKNYVREPGSAWVRRLLADPATTPMASEIIIAEVSAAIAIMVRVQRLRAGQGRRAYTEFMADVVAGRYGLIPLGRAAVVAAADLAQKHPLKAYDALHLATALHLQSELASHGRSATLIGGDNRMLEAAAAEGLSV